MWERFCGTNASCFDGTLVYGLCCFLCCVVWDLCILLLFVSGKVCVLGKNIVCWDGTDFFSYLKEEYD